MTVKILADSTCDLSAELLKKYDVDTIPLNVILHDKILRDKIDIVSSDVIEWSNKNNTTPKTSAPNIEEFETVYKKYADAGRDMVVITVSGDLSATFQSANIAKESFDSVDIRIVDSRNLTLGQGLLVMEAAELAQEGLDAQEIETRLNEMIPKIKTSFFLSTLTFLSRGGRCSALAAFGANTLNIKPLIVAENGKLVPGAKFRGSLTNVCEKYVDTVLADLKKIDPKRVFVAYSPTDTGIVDIAHEIVKSKNYFKEILVEEVGCVITCHAGPSALGVLYIEK